MTRATPTNAGLRGDIMLKSALFGPAPERMVSSQ
ncbi:hypothetical protein SAMN05421869_105349 [Nonomuraea jiangxiensis]|uniref:Uncharacterized protein n=1 Tax=Nonomuraea jiangxiensis TaxID=633440 RepID=A0A1G8KCA9_9ACTN|nr:hypothetical protein SAMN05421869_105349 [Nonomuraea jiangxiensis]